MKYRFAVGTVVVIICVDFRSALCRYGTSYDRQVMLHVMIVLRLYREAIVLSPLYCYYITSELIVRVCYVNYACACICVVFLHIFIGFWPYWNELEGCFVCSMLL